RKSSTTWRTAVRDSSSARTLTSSSSRSTVFPGSSSTILRTLISLLSCFVTCSRGSSAASTTTVIRETSSRSVGPTASEWMLNARRANSAVTLVRTPGLFSTRTDSVCLVLMSFPSVLVLEVGREPAGVLDVVVGDAAGDHGPHHRVAADDEVDED